MAGSYVMHAIMIYNNYMYYLFSQIGIQNDNYDSVKWQVYSMDYADSI